MSLDTEIFSFLQLFLSWGFLLFSFLRYGKSGVYIFIVLAVILSNIQVMKFGTFFWTSDPVALGTVLFSSTFLAGNLLAEFYSLEVARRAISLGFFGMAFFSLQMLLQIWIPISDNAPDHNIGHHAMVTLFSPMPWLYLSSTISYFISERTDVRLFTLLKIKTNGRFLWLRTLVASCVSAFLDTLIFSVLAWKIFVSLPISWSELIHTYVLGSLWPRFVIAGLGVPVLYLLKRPKIQSFLKKENE